MSDFIEDSLRKRQATNDVILDLLAASQRQRGLDNQHKQTAELQRQTAELQRQTEAIEAQNRVEQDRTGLERQRLIIEEQRLQIENSEREARRLHAEQIKQLRVLMAGTMDSLDRLKKLRPAP